MRQKNSLLSVNNRNKCGSPGGATGCGFLQRETVNASSQNLSGAVKYGIPVSSVPSNNGSCNNNCDQNVSSCKQVMNKDLNDVVSSINNFGVCKTEENMKTVNDFTRGINNGETFENGESEIRENDLGENSSANRTVIPDRKVAVSNVAKTTTELNKKVEDAADLLRNVSISSDDDKVKSVADLKLNDLFTAKLFRNVHLYRSRNQLSDSSSSDDESDYDDDDDDDEILTDAIARSPGVFYSKNKDSVRKTPYTVRGSTQRQNSQPGNSHGCSVRLSDDTSLPELTKDVLELLDRFDKDDGKLMKELDRIDLLVSDASTVNNLDKNPEVLDKPYLSSISTPASNNSFVESPYNSPHSSFSPDSAISLHSQNSYGLIASPQQPVPLDNVLRLVPEAGDLDTPVFEPRHEFNYQISSASSLPSSDSNMQSQLSSSSISGDDLNNCYPWIDENGGLCFQPVTGTLDTANILENSTSFCSTMSTPPSNSSFVESKKETNSCTPNNSPHNSFSPDSEMSLYSPKFYGLIASPQQAVPSGNVLPLVPDVGDLDTPVFEQQHEFNYQISSASSLPSSDSNMQSQLSSASISSDDLNNGSPCIVENYGLFSQPITGTFDKGNILENSASFCSEPTSNIKNDNNFTTNNTLLNGGRLIYDRSAILANTTVTFDDNLPINGGNISPVNKLFQNITSSVKNIYPNTSVIDSSNTQLVETVMTDSRNIIGNSTSVEIQLRLTENKSNNVAFPVTSQLNCLTTSTSKRPSTGSLPSSNKLPSTNNLPSTSNIPSMSKEKPMTRKIKSAKMADNGNFSAVVEFVKRNKKDYRAQYHSMLADIEKMKTSEADEVLVNFLFELSSVFGDTKNVQGGRKNNSIMKKLERLERLWKFKLVAIVHIILGFLKKPDIFLQSHRFDKFDYLTPLQIAAIFNYKEPLLARCIADCIIGCNGNPDQILVSNNCTTPSSILQQLHQRGESHRAVFDVLQNMKYPDGSPVFTLNHGISQINDCISVPDSVATPLAKEKPIFDEETPVLLWEEVVADTAENHNILNPESIDTQNVHIDNSIYFEYQDLLKFN